MSLPRALFVAGAGTEIGKTYVTAALTRSLREAGRPVLALKPLASGVPPVGDPAFLASDTAILLAAQGVPVTAETIEACSPWRFLAPLAPDQAAAREGRALTLDDLVSWCEAQLGRSNPHPHPVVCGAAEPRRSPLGVARHDAVLLRGRFAVFQDEEPGGSVVGAQLDVTLLIEGVGGLMSPITDDATGLDWLKRLKMPALLVSGSHLGAISHALTAIETLRAHQIPLAGVVVSESLGAPTEPEVVAEAIARRISAPVEVLRRDAGFTASASRFVR